MSPLSPDRSIPHRLPVANTTLSRSAAGRRAVATIDGRPRDRALRCVSSGYLSGGGSCQAAVPARVVTAAWARELAQSGVRSDRLFHFLWRGHEWLGFGLADGEVRGVYCPIHSEQRMARYHAQRSEGQTLPSSLAS